MGWPIKKPEYKVSEDVARAQITLILEHYQIDVDGIPNEDAKASLKYHLDRLIGYVRQGMVVVQENPFKVIQNLVKPPGGSARPIEYEEMRGEHHVAMDAHDSKSHYQRIYTLMASLSGLDSLVFKKIEGADLSVVETLGSVFLSA